MTKNVKLTRKHRHGNCVPFLITNVQTGTMTFKGSLNEVADKLKISQSMASYYHSKGSKVTKGKSLYTITRMGFDTSITLGAY